MLSSVLNSEVEISHYLRADLESHTFVNCSTTILSLDYSVILWSLGYSVLAVSINFLLCGSLVKQGLIGNGNGYIQMLYRG